MSQQDQKPKVRHKEDQEEEEEEEEEAEKTSNEKLDVYSSYPEIVPETGPSKAAYKTRAKPYPFQIEN